jgi:uncharacterized protein (TIGR02722 family)
MKLKCMFCSLHKSMSLMVMILLLISCAGPSVKRTEVDETIDLSGRWNDTDSRLVSEEMIADCLNRPWLQNYQAKSQGNMPTVIVGTVKNQSYEHINTQVFIKDLERALINSGRVRFVASKDERIELRQEKADQQQGFTDPGTQKSMYKEVGADYMLQGSINAIKDEIKGEYVMLYQVNLELVHLETNLKAWIGQKEIKKVVKRSRLSW